LRGQIAFASRRGGDAPPLLLKAARRFEPLDPRLARDTYLDALAAATFAGRLAFGGGIPAVAEAARAAPPSREPARPHDLLLDGLTLLISEGHAAGAPALRHAVRAFRDAEGIGEEGLRWLWLAWYAASIVWDYQSWDVLSARHVMLARHAGALTELPIAFNTRAEVHLLAGRFTEADSMDAEAASVTEVIGSSLAPYGALSLAAFRGREAEASHLAETVIKDVERRGRGPELRSLGQGGTVQRPRPVRARAYGGAAGERLPTFAVVRQLGAGRAYRGGRAQRGARARGRCPAAALGNGPRLRDRLGTWHRGPLASTGQRRRGRRAQLWRGD
jgi:hypothetical protein